MSGLCLSTTIPESSAAFPFVEKLENRSGLMRMLLEDTVKVNGELKGYVGLPEKERLAKFFGVKPTRKEAGQSVSKAVAQMKAGERERLAYEVEYVRLCQKYWNIFVRGIPLDCFLVQFVMSYAKKLAKEGVSPQGIEYTVLANMKEFGDWCACNCSNAGWLEKLEEKECACGEAERLFVHLADQWFSNADMLPKTKGCAPGQIVDFVLDFMDRYIDSGHTDNAHALSVFTRYMEKSFNETEKAQNPAG